MWNDKTYREFEQVRLQPSIDLAKRVTNRNYKSILDIGCGSGMSTKAVMDCIQSADKIVAIDSSPEMLASAEKAVEGVNWIERDCSIPMDDLGQFDVMFSNAFLQWLSPAKQKEFIQNSVKNLSEDGVFAIQIPNFDSLPIAKCCQETTKEWKSYFKGELKSKYMNYTPEEYYEMFLSVYASVTIWTTTYYQPMSSIDDIVTFAKGTALHPVIQQLSETDFNQYCSSLKKKLKKYYHNLCDGTILFPFERIFLLARKCN